MKKTLGAGVVLVAALGLVASCSSSSDHDSSSPLGGAPTVGGASAAAIAGGGMLARGGHSQGGEATGGGTPSRDASAGGTSSTGAAGAGSAQGGETTDGGIPSRDASAGGTSSTGAAGAGSEQGGEAGAVSVPPRSCMVTGQCPASQFCYSSSGVTEKRCIALHDDCQNVPDCSPYQRCDGAGRCVNGRPLGAACSSDDPCGLDSDQTPLDCVSFKCVRQVPGVDAGTGYVELGPCDPGYGNCPTGQGCIYRQDVARWSCFDLTQYCQSDTCIGGFCDPGERPGPDGLQHCTPYQESVGANCEPSADGLGARVCDPNGLYCSTAIPGTCTGCGTCQSSPGPGQACFTRAEPKCIDSSECSPCAAGLVCWNQQCTATFAEVGESCSTLPCENGSLCVDTQVNGVCTSGCPSGEVIGSSGGSTASNTDWALWPMPNSASMPNVPNHASYTPGAYTVVDNVTHLTWQRFPDTLGFGEYTWEDAKAYCASLRLDCHTDWRLPSRIELVSLMDYTQLSVEKAQQGVVAAIDPMAFPGTPPERFWTSTVSASKGFTYPYVWDVDFKTGEVSPDDTQLTGYRVRCVR